MGENQGTRYRHVAHIMCVCVCVYIYKPFYVISNTHISIQVMVLGKVLRMYDIGGLIIVVDYLYC